MHYSLSAGGACSGTGPFFFFFSFSPPGTVAFLFVSSGVDRVNTLVFLGNVWGVSWGARTGQRKRLVVGF